MKKAAVFAPILASISLASAQVSVNFTGLGSQSAVGGNEGGTDGVLNVNDAWRMNNVLPGTYAVVKIEGFSVTRNTPGTAPTMLIQSDSFGGTVFEHVAGNISTPSPAYSNALGIDFRATNYNHAICDFSLSFFDNTTNLPVNITQTFSVFDLDSDGGGLRETVGIGAADISSYHAGSLLTESSDGSYLLFSGPTDALYNNIDAQDPVVQPDMTVVFDVVGQNSISFRWEFDHDPTGSSSRRFYLAGTDVTIPEPGAGLCALVTVAAACLRRRRP